MEENLLITKEFVPNAPYVIEILSLETAIDYRLKDENTERKVKPVGKWLIWYAIKLASKSPPSPNSEPSNLVIVLTTDKNAKLYYEHLGFKQIWPSGEDDIWSSGEKTLLMMDEEAGLQFSKDIEEKFGEPTSTNRST